MEKVIFLFAVLFSSISFDSHAYEVGSGDYTRGQARNVQNVQSGVVTAVREISIEGEENSNTGSYVGGVVGAAVGYAVGGDHQYAAASILGALGAVVGRVTQQQLQSRKGLEIQVRLKSGDEIVVSQAADQLFNEGDKVRLINGNGVVRVTR